MRLQDRQHRRSARQSPEGIFEDRAELFAVVTGNSSEAVLGACRTRDIAPACAAVGTDLPLDRRSWIARGRSGEARR